MAPSRIVALAKEIEASTAKLDEYFGKNNLPYPSLEEDGPLKFPQDIVATQEALSAALDELWWLNQGPIHTIKAKAFASSIGLKFILKYNIQNLVPLETGTTFQELATQTKLPVNKLTRILRSGMTEHLFREPQPGHIKHNAATKALVQVPNIATWAQMAMYEVVPAKMHLVDALAKWPESEEPNQAGFNIAHGTDRTMFEFFDDHPDRLSRFKDAMNFLQSSPGLDNELLLTGFDWASLGDATVVDLGGSHGRVSNEISQVFPNLHFVVQDRPTVVEHAKAKAQPDMSDRVRFMAHSFFEEQPIKDADVYYFRYILHDWSDKYCIKILRALVPALKRGASVVLTDKCLEPPCTAPARQEMSDRDADMLIMSMLNAPERNQTEWGALFQAVDPRLKLQEVKRLEGAELALIIARWD